MADPNELRATAEQLLKQAKAAGDPSEGLLYVMRSVECDTQADLLEQDHDGEIGPAQRALHL